MKNSTWLSFYVAVIALSIAGSALPESKTSAQMQQIAQSMPKNVIVILRDQLPNVAPMRSAMVPRAAAITASQSSLIVELQQTRTRNIRSFRTINAFATSVSPAESARLAARPEVQAVVPTR